MSNLITLDAFKWGIFGFLYVVTSTAFAVSTTAEPANFSQCVEGLKQRALSERISQAVVDNDLAGVNFVRRVIELDRKQPEFSQTFYNYYSQRVTKARVQMGQELLKKHQSLLNKLNQKYGVPPQYLIAFWGMETNFGRYLGKMNVLDSLATLACDPRRSEFFTLELFEALRLIDAGIVSGTQMRGSWAGAMGNMQFMPSAYRRYALDADQDGRIDLWGSLPDAFTSAANYLQQIHWKRGWRWGREVSLPKSFDYSLAGRNKPKPIKAWAAMGVKQSNGERLPDLDEPAALVVPAGHNGPAFLVYDNFHVMLKWNLSEFYALSVGILADQIKTGMGLKVSPPKQDPLSIETIKKLQMALNLLGHDAGDVDGVFGSNTKRALRTFQKANNLIADGYPSDETLKSLHHLAKIQVQ